MTKAVERTKKAPVVDDEKVRLSLKENLYTTSKTASNCGF